MKSVILALVLSLLSEINSQVQPNIAAIATFKLCSDPNALYTECGPSCGGDGCSPVVYATAASSPSVSNSTINPGGPVLIGPCIQQCRAACFCKCGYFRNPQTGLCVPGSQCPNGITNTQYSQLCPGIGQCCGPNQYFTQSNSCLDQCPTYRYYSLPTPVGTAASTPPVQQIAVPFQPFCPLYLTSGCFCISGFKRNSLNACVPIRQCPVYPYPISQLPPISSPKTTATASRK